MADTPKAHGVAKVDWSDIRDPRADFWRRHFELAKDYDTYLAESEQDKAVRWYELAQNLPPLTDQQVARLRGFQRKCHVLMYSGVWCGDCVRQGPMLRRIAEACGPNVGLRIIDREVSSELQDELRILGGRRVPAVVFLSEDFYEVGRFGDRLLSAYRVKADLDTGQYCDTGLVPPPGQQLAAEMGDWVDVFERMLLMVRLSGYLRHKHGD